MEDLLDNSTDLSTRNSFISCGEGLADQLNEYAVALERLQTECNDQIKVQVDAVNSIAKQIATLNRQINTVELAGVTANELRDQRALLVDQLSSIAQVEVEESDVPSNMMDKNGDPIMTGATSYRVTIGGQTLVSDFSYEQLKVVPRTEKLNQSDADGLYDIVWENGTDFNMCNNNLGGELQGLIQMRDGNNAENLKGIVKSADAATDTIVLTDATVTDISLMTLPAEGKITLNYHEFAYDSFSFDEATGEYTFHLKDDLTDTEAARIKNNQGVVGNTVDYMGIPYYMSKLNEFCRSYAMAFNSIHQSGVDLNGDQGGLFFTGEDEVQGTEYQFGDGNQVGSATDTYYCLTAKNFCVSNALTKNPSLLATASEIVNGVARTDVLQELRDMHSKATIGNFTPTEFFETLLSDIAISTKDSKDMTENYESLGNVITNQRLSVSGVDEDEEALDLVKFQNAYNLNSKVISIMNECYDKLINETGVT
jgi:flagellar hook-associated protein 1 FlgK